MARDKGQIYEASDKFKDALQIRLNANFKSLFSDFFIRILTGEIVEERNSKFSV